MRIDEAMKLYPKTISTFERFGLRCFGCSVSGFEDIEAGALSHHIDLDTLLEELNRVA